MVKIFENFDDEFELSKEAYAFIKQNPLNSINQIDVFFEKMSISFTEKDIYYIFELYNYAIPKEIQSHIIEKAYDFFTKKISEMLDSHMYSGAKTLLDLFWHNWKDINWSKIDRNIRFLNNTYPLLFCEDEFAEIAARFYWHLINNSSHFENQNDLLKSKFIKDYYYRYKELFPFGE